MIPAEWFRCEQAFVRYGACQESTSIGNRSHNEFSCFRNYFRGSKILHEKASGKIIVGADGVFFKNRIVYGDGKAKICSMRAVSLKSIQPLSQTCEIFFNTEYAPGGYVWIYRQEKTRQKWRWSNMSILECILINL